MTECQRENSEWEKVRVGGCESESDTHTPVAVARIKARRRVPPPPALDHPVRIE